MFGASKPAVSTSKLHSTSRSPDLNDSMAADLASLSVFESTYAVFMP